MLPLFFSRQKNEEKIMSKNREDSYIFCAALIRASERSFLPESELTRAAEAADFAGAMSVLTENGYGSLKAPEKPRDFAKLLAEEERRNYDFVFSALPDQEELVLFRYPKDYHNAKAVLKAEFLGTDPEKYLTEGGSFSPEAMVSMIRERNFVFMSSEMKEAVNRAAEVFGKGRDPQEIDIILDKACFSQMLDAAEKTENLFLINYVRLLIDILNVITFVRLRQMKKPWTFFSKIFLQGGQMAESLFVGGYEENYHKLAERFRPYGFAEIIEKGGEKVRETGMYSLLEKLCDNKRIEYIKDAKYISFGIEPAAAYLIAKDSEIKNLRMIFTGKIAGTPKEVILERLRKTYV